MGGVMKKIIFLITMSIKSIVIFAQEGRYLSQTLDSTDTAIDLLLVVALILLILFFFIFYFSIFIFKEGFGSKKTVPEDDNTIDEIYGGESDDYPGGPLFI